MLTFFELFDQQTGKVAFILSIDPGYTRVFCKLTRGATLSGKVVASTWINHDEAKALAGLLSSLKDPRV